MKNINDDIYVMDEDFSQPAFEDFEFYVQNTDPVQDSYLEEDTDLYDYMVERSFYAN